MNLEIILQIAGISMVVAILHTVLEGANKKELAQMVVLGGVIVVVWLIIGLVAELFDTVQTLFRF